MKKTLLTILSTITLNAFSVETQKASISPEDLVAFHNITYKSFNIPIDPNTGYSFTLYINGQAFSSSQSLHILSNTKKLTNQKFTVLFRDEGDHFRVAVSAPGLIASRGEVKKPKSLSMTVIPGGLEFDSKNRLVLGAKPTLNKTLIKGGKDFKYADSDGCKPETAKACLVFKIHKNIKK